MSSSIGSSQSRRHSSVIKPHTVPDFTLPFGAHPRKRCASSASPGARPRARETVSPVPAAPSEPQPTPPEPRLSVSRKACPNRSSSLPCANSPLVTSSSSSSSPTTSLKKPLSARDLISSLFPAKRRREPNSRSSTPKRGWSRLGQYLWSAPKRGGGGGGGGDGDPSMAQASSDGDVRAKAPQSERRLRVCSEDDVLRPARRPATGGSGAVDPHQALPRTSIEMSVAYMVRLKRLVVQVHGLSADLSAGRGRRGYRVELSLSSPGSCLRASSCLDRLPQMAVFPDIMSLSLASQTLSVRVTTKGRQSKARQALYEASLPLADLSLIGDANWYPVKPLHTKVASQSSVTICLCYHVHSSKFVVTVVNAKNLKKKSTLRKRTYVELNFLSGDENARRTKCRGGSSPVFKEAFSIKVDPVGLSSRYTELTLTVRQQSLGWEDEVLGRVNLASDMLLRWKTSECVENTLDEAFRYPGRVITQIHRL